MRFSSYTHIDQLSQGRSIGCVCVLTVQYSEIETLRWNFFELSTQIAMLKINLKPFKFQLMHYTTQIAEVLLTLIDSFSPLPPPAFKRQKLQYHHSNTKHPPLYI